MPGKRLGGNDPVKFLVLQHLLVRRIGLGYRIALRHVAGDIRTKLGESDHLAKIREGCIVLQMGALAHATHPNKPDLYLPVVHCFQSPLHCDLLL